MVFPDRYRVVKKYVKAYADPIAIAANEEVTVSDRVDTWNGNPSWIWLWCIDKNGRSGWVPQNLLIINGDRAIATQNYSALELDAEEGEILTAINDASGWMWCKNMIGLEGWIPIDHLQIVQ